MRSTRCLSVAVGLLLILALTGTTAHAAGEITVGRFVQDLARIRSLSADDARIAANALAAAGVQLPTSLNFDSPLTEADVKLISGAAGLRVNTTTPDALFDARQAERFFVVFGSELGGEVEPAADADERTRRGSRSRHRRCDAKPSASRPDVCRR